MTAVLCPYYCPRYFYVEKVEFISVYSRLLSQTRHSISLAKKQRLVLEFASLQIVYISLNSHSQRGSPLD